MPKGQKTGYAVNYKRAGMRAVNGDNLGRQGGALGEGKVSMLMKEIDIKESMKQKPSKNNPCFKNEGGLELMKLNEILVNKSNYQELREAKDMANEMTKKIKKALDEIPKGMKTQGDINIYISNVIGGKQGEMLKMMLEATLGK
jgi:hypothetical protein